MIHPHKLVKVCGMREPDNIRDLLTLHPDFMGLIFYSRSPRSVQINPELIRLLTEARKYKLVGVFVNESLSGILQIHKALNLDYVQLHGSESPEFCRALKSSGIGVIKAVGVQSSNDLEDTQLYESDADFLLFDTQTRAHGGSGIQFDWTVLEHYHGALPFLLSGGIGPGDFPSISHEKFAGVDLNSRFETHPGHKNLDLIGDYIKKFRI